MKYSNLYQSPSVLSELCKTKSGKIRMIFFNCINIHTICFFNYYLHNYNDLILHNHITHYRCDENSCHESFEVLPRSIRKFSSLANNNNKKKEIELTVKDVHQYSVYPHLILHAENIEWHTLKVLVKLEDLKGISKAPFECSGQKMQLKI